MALHTRLSSCQRSEGLGSSLSQGWIQEFEIGRVLRAILQVKRDGSGGCLYRISVKRGGAHPLHHPPGSSPVSPILEFGHAS